MNSKQYEELCRFFLADKLGIGIDEVKSVIIQNPSKPGLQKYKHQIDLYWETGDEIVQYLNVANAKWRGKVKVKQGEVLLLQKVKDDIQAHKAMISHSALHIGIEWQFAELTSPSSFPRQ